MILQDRLTHAIAALRAAGVGGADRDARLLLAHVHGIDAGRLTLHLRDEDGWGAAQESHFLDAVQARATRKPVAKIIGRKAFWGRDFHVNDHVLDPRPETETLIAAALDTPFQTVLDIGTGSGIIAITLLAERPQAKATATDISAHALTVAQRNAETFDVGVRLTLRQADMFDGIDGRFDLIASNPPYLAATEMNQVPADTLFDPRQALTDEADGLTYYRQIAAQSANHLTPNGTVMVEIGPTQGAAVAQMFQSAGFADVVILPDLDGRTRVVVAKALKTT